MIHLTDHGAPATVLEVDPSDATAGHNVDLLDRVIDRIFTAGILLEAATNEATPRGASSIRRAVAELDDALREIRREVFQASALIDRPTGPDL